MLSRFLAATLVLSAAFAQGQTRTSGTQVLTEVTPEQMRSVLRGMGFEFTEKQSGETYTFSFQLNGYKVTLVDLVKDMQLYAGFSDKVDLAKINEWNKKYRFCRVYMDTDGGSYIESDLSFAGGVTRDTIDAFIKQYRGTLTSYARFLTGAESSGDTKTSPQIPSFIRSPSAQKRVTTPVGDFVVWIDESKWKQEESEEAGVVKFHNASGDAFARVITERIKIPTNGLREIALINAKKADPKAKIVFEERRVVNGKPLLALQIAGVVKNMPIRYYGYYHGGTSGTLQVVVFTMENQFEASLPELDQFLNGLEISDDELPDAVSTSGTEEKAKPGTLTFNGGKMSVQYDPEKWKQSESEEAGRYRLAHLSGDGYAMVIAERLTVATDSLPDIALANAKEADPNAKIIFREKRRINGIEVWFLKIQADVKSIPLIYYGYYYGGEAGTVQLIAYTGQSLAKDYEKDFMALLNGLRITP